MRRRRLLQFAAGVSALHTLGTDDSVRELLDLTMGSRTIEEWHLASADHLHAVRTRLPAQAHRDLLIDLAALQRQLSLGGPDTAELHRVAAVLACYEGSVMVRLADPGAAIRWYRTAKSAADASGDLDLRVRVRAHEAEHSLFGVRDPGTVLTLCEEAERMAGSSLSVGSILIARVRAHALAMMGRHSGALAALRTFLDLATADLPTVPGFWEPSDYRLAISECQVHAAAGREREVSRAAENVLTGAPVGYQVPLYARLYLAQCVVSQGGVDQGARQAATALDSLPESYRNVMVTETARRVLSAVPVDQRQRPAVAELRQLAITA